MKRLKFKRLKQLRKRRIKPEKNNKLEQKTTEYKIKNIKQK